MKNNNQVEDFKPAEGESWRGTFANKLVAERPAWSGKCKMCPRWHIKGDCFSDCKNKASHVPQSKVPADKNRKFDAWMDKDWAS